MPQSVDSVNSRAVSVEATAGEVEEYNAFGPWVDLVSNPIDLPRMWASYPLDFSEALRVLKFPRPESRRDLLAGMHLYDYLLVLTSDELKVLQRDGDTFQEGAFRLSELTSISSGADLLDGRLTLSFISGDTYAIPYNGSATGTITALVDTVRDLIRADGTAIGVRPQTTSIPMPMALDDLGRADAGLVNAANALFVSDPRISVLVAVGRRERLSSRDPIARFRHSLKPATLHGAVIATAPDELIVISRVAWISRDSRPQLSLVRTIIPLSRIDSIEPATHPDYSDVSVVEVRSASSRVLILLPDPALAAEVARVK